MINDARLSLSSSFLEFNSLVEPRLKNGKIFSGERREGEKAVDFEAIGHKEEHDNSDVHRPMSMMLHIIFKEMKEKQTNETNGKK